jgi:hypothetical protein
MPAAGGEVLFTGARAYEDYNERFGPKAHRMLRNRDAFWTPIVLQ